MCQPSSPLRSYWIPGSYDPLVSEKRNSFLRLLKNKAFKKERKTKNGVYAIGEYTTLEFNKSQRNKLSDCSKLRINSASGTPCLVRLATKPCSLYNQETIIGLHLFVRA